MVAFNVGHQQITQRREGVGFKRVDELLGVLGI